jgi:hypothetical protein|tara:strand:+ start:438 stop:920 length:483 start_codon:yes stop_codon:yes gene_type:complete
VTNTRGTNADKNVRKAFAIDLLCQNIPDSLVVEELHKKYKKSYQTHRSDVREAKKEIVKESTYTQEEFNYVLQQNFDNIQEAYYKAKEDNNVSAMVGACKTQNSAIRNYVAIKRDLDYPEMWQNELDNLPRQSLSDLDRLDNIYVHPWDKHCQEQDQIPF